MADELITFWPSGLPNSGELATVPASRIDDRLGDVIVSEIADSFFPLPSSLQRPLSWHTSSNNFDSSNSQKASGAITAGNDHLHQRMASGSSNTHISENCHPALSATSSYRTPFTVAKHPEQQVQNPTFSWPDHQNAIDQTTADFENHGSATNFQSASPLVASNSAPPVVFHNDPNQYLRLQPPFSAFHFQQNQQYLPQTSVPTAWLESPPSPGEAEWSCFDGGGIFEGPPLNISKLHRRRKQVALDTMAPTDGSLIADDDSQLDAMDTSPRHAANVRERRRMRLLNEAFGRLKNHVPQDLFAEQKRSKLTVLRGAIRYIQLLSDTLMARGGYHKVGLYGNGGPNGSVNQGPCLQQVRRPQSVIISPSSGLNRHRISWRISDSATSTIGRLSPRPNGSPQNKPVYTNAEYEEPLAMVAKLKCITWRPGHLTKAEPKF